MTPNLNDLCPTCGSPKELMAPLVCPFCGSPNEDSPSYCTNPQCQDCHAAFAFGPYRKSTSIATVSTVPTKLLVNRINDLSAHIHQLNHRWWHDKDGNRLDRNPAELICLMHSELSEAMEGERKDLMDDHLPHRKMVEVEMADTIIRILDFCGSRGYDIQGAIAEKLIYNQSRADHSHEAREADGGKRF